MRRPLIAIVMSLAFLIPVSANGAQALGASGPNFYVAPASAGGSDSNDCSQATQGGAGIGPCETLLKATSAAGSYFKSNGEDQSVFVYMEPGVYSDAAHSVLCTGMVMLGDL